ncbi:MAG: YidC/Oxa1 family membrane protein insertase, partial [Acidimicrobiales bacterium]
MFVCRTASTVLAESSLIHLVGGLFHPVFVVLATVLAAIYGLTASYGFAIVVLTIVIMALLMPLTISSTRSMMAMQRLRPKITRLQQKYKGPENREQLNRELMRVYKEEGINPAGSCLPLLLQIPLLVVLYDVIKGLTNSFVAMAQGHPVAVAQPRYIPTSSKMYHNLVASHGAMNWLGINLALRPLSAHPQWFGVLPYLALVFVAVVLQWVQLAQARRHTPAAAQANPQMQTVQKFLPLLFVYVYLVIPAAVVLYIVVSTMVRIGTQHFLFRGGNAEPP